MEVEFFFYLWYNFLIIITKMSFFRRHPRPQKIKRSAFGGIVKSQEEVEALHDKIETHEEREAMQADIELEQQIKEL